VRSGGQHPTADADAERAGDQVPAGRLRTTRAARARRHLYHQDGTKVDEIPVANSLGVLAAVQS
jgi:hypothetical protein